MTALVLFLATSAGAAEPDFPLLLSDSGWEDVGTRSHDDIGTVDIKLKKIDGAPCLMGTVAAEVEADVLYDVVSDIPSAMAWSTAGLTKSKVLGRSGATVDYLQFLDVPNWTMASDRFWVLRGKDASESGTRAFRWWKFDAEAAYPETFAQIAEENSGALQPDVNWGQWMFTPEGGKTIVKYLVCTDPGGSMPEWLGKAAATRTLPDTVADVVREGRKRAGK